MINEIENMTNQTVIRDFFKATIDIIAENTSRNYSVLAINGLKEQLEKEFKFSKNVHITGGSIKVDEAINSVGVKELNKFFTKIVDFIGPNYLKMLLTQKLTPTDVKYLENIGLKFG